MEASLPDSLAMIEGAYSAATDTMYIAFREPGPPVHMLRFCNNARVHIDAAGNMVGIDVAEWNTAPTPEGAPA